MPGFAPALCRTVPARNAVCFIGCKAGKHMAVEKGAAFVDSPDSEFWRMLTPTPTEALEGRGKGGGFGTQKFVYQKWPHQISSFPTTVTLVWEGGGGPGG